MSQQQYEEQGAKQEWFETESDRLFRESLTAKYPSLKGAWPGKEKSPVLTSGNGNGFAPSSKPNKETIMPRISEMLPSNYLKQSDFPEDYIVTVRGVEKKNIAMDGKPADYKWLAKFAEFDKPMVLNTTNIQLMAKACGSDDTDDWAGKQVIVFVDENVSFGGELVGGLRIRKIKQAAPVAPRRATPEAAASSGFDNMDDDIPY